MTATQLKKWKRQAKKDGLLDDYDNTINHQAFKKLREKIQNTKDEIISMNIE